MLEEWFKPKISISAQNSLNKVGRGSVNKYFITAAVSLNETGHPCHVRITSETRFGSDAISEWGNVT